MNRTITSKLVWLSQIDQLPSFSLSCHQEHGDVLPLNRALIGCRKQSRIHSGLEYRRTRFKHLTLWFNSQITSTPIEASGSYKISNQLCSFYKNLIKCSNSIYCILIMPWKVAWGLGLLVNPICHRVRDLESKVQSSLLTAEW